MTERSVSIFLLDTFKRWWPYDLEIEEYRAFTELPPESVTDAMLVGEAIKVLNVALSKTASDEYRGKIMHELIFGNEDFQLSLGVNAATRVVVVRDTPATSFLVVPAEDNEPTIVLGDFVRVTNVTGDVHISL
jgi:hypothetical protein